MNLNQGFFYIKKRWWCIHLLLLHHLHIQLLFGLKKLQVNFWMAQIGLLILIFVMPSISIIGFHFTPSFLFFFLYVYDFSYWLFKKIQSRRWKVWIFIHGFWFLVSIMICMCLCMHVLIWVFDFLFAGSWWWVKVTSFGFLGFCE